MRWKSVGPAPAPEASEPASPAMPRWRSAAVVLLAAAYALPLFAPPDATPLLLDGPTTSLIERLFPGVPAWWISGRLGCLMLAAWLGSIVVKPGRSVLPVCRTSIEPPTKAQLLVAIALASALLWLGWHAAELPRAGQLAFLFATPLPALALTSRRIRTWRRADRALSPWILVVLLAWASFVAPTTWRSTWMTNVVDTLGPFTVLERSVADPELNLLIGDLHSRVSGVFLVGQGAGLTAVFGEMPWMQIVQLCNLIWIGTAGITVAILGARIFGVAAAPVLTAALLFAPYTMASTLFLAPMALGLVSAPAGVLLLSMVIGSRSSAALVGLGSLVGLQVTNPTLTLLVGLLFTIAMVSAWSRPRLPPLASVAALLVFLATALPGAPRALQVREFATAYARGPSSWAMVEALYLGQVDPERVKFAEDVEPSARLEAPLGSLLAPFAAPRTAMRVWGDAIFEPFTSVMVAVGIAVCLRARSRESLLLLVLLVAALLPSFASSYDRASLTRSAGLVAPLLVLAGVGFTHLRDTWFGGVRERVVGTVGAILVAASGCILTEHVRPTILARSATGIALDALADGDAARATILVPAWWDAQGSAIFASALPRHAVATLRYDGLATLRGTIATIHAPILFWSPALEEQRPVGREICANWPRSRVFTIHDDAGLSHAFVANPMDRHWTPGLARHRWRESACGDPLDTAQRRARIAVAQARHHLAAGRPQPAIDLLRAAARQSIVDVSIFDLLARTLLRYRVTEAELVEATFWADRAVRISNSCPSRPVSTLVRAYTLAGRDRDRREARARARRMRAVLCRGLPVGHPWRTP